MTVKGMLNNAMATACSLAPAAKFGPVAGIVVGWLAWPALTDNFKQNTLGISPPAAPVSVLASAPKTMTGDYVFEKLQVGERPSLAQD